MKPTVKQSLSVHVQSKPTNDIVEIELSKQECFDKVVVPVQVRSRPPRDWDQTIYDGKPLKFVTLAASCFLS